MSCTFDIFTPIKPKVTIVGLPMQFRPGFNGILNTNTIVKFVSK